MTREQLKKMIWLRIREKLAVSDFDDDQIREFRENAVYEVTSVSRGKLNAIIEYSLCTDAELQWVLDYITQPQRTLNKVIPNDGTIHRATRNQVDKVRFLGLKCALHYAKFEQLEYVNKATGEVLSGDELRNYATDKFYRNTLQRDHSEISSFLYRTWLNPKIHEFLMTNSKNRYYFKHDQLTHSEADLLIKRFEKMSVEITERYQEIRDVMSLN